MAKENITISEAELKIMKILWRQSAPVTTKNICAAIADTEWKRTTVSTLLTRLAEKGAVYGEKRNGNYYYTPLITKKDYRSSQTKNLIQNLYSGSVRELAVSLFEECHLSGDDIKELRAIFDDKEA